MVECCKVANLAHTCLIELYNHLSCSLQGLIRVLTRGRMGSHLANVNAGHCYSPTLYALYYPCPQFLSQYLVHCGVRWSPTSRDIEALICQPPTVCGRVSHCDQINTLNDNCLRSCLCYPPVFTVTCKLERL